MYHVPSSKPRCSAVAASCVRAQDVPAVALAEDVYNSLNHELQHIRLHSEQIFREYQKHKIHAAAVEQQLQTVRETVLGNFKVDLQDYVYEPLPIYANKLSR